MRARIIAALLGLSVILAICVAGRSSAQDRSKSQSPDRGRLRAEVAKLRAEVDALQIERDVDADRLKKLTTDVRNLEDMEAVNEFMKQKLPGLRAKFGKNEEAEADLKKEFDLNSMTAELARPSVERVRKAFLKRAEELAGKRLELSEAERLHNDAK